MFDMNKNTILKAFSLPIVLSALLLPTAARAQAYDDYYVFDNTAESAYDMNDLGMFDWADFTDLFDQAVQNSALEERFSDFSMFDLGDLAELGNRDSWGFTVNTHDFGDSPLGNGVVLLVGAGLGYIAFKRRKEEEK